MEVGAAACDDGGFGAAAVDDVDGGGNHRAAVSEGVAAAGGATAGRTNDGHDNIDYSSQYSEGDTPIAILANRATGIRALD